MGKKYEITETHINGYVKYLESKKAKYEREASKLNYHINRLDAKIKTAEKSLRKDLAEGVIEASKAAGIPLAKKVPASPGQVPAPARADDFKEIPTIEMKLETKTKKDDWEEWK